MKEKKVDTKLKFVYNYGATTRTHLKSLYTANKQCISSCSSIWFCWIHCLTLFCGDIFTQFVFTIIGNFSYAYITHAYSIIFKLSCLYLWIIYMIVFNSFVWDKNFSSIYSKRGEILPLWNFCIKLKFYF